MDIPGKDTDVNINVSGETQNLSATEKAVNTLRNAIANLGRAADGADDEVDDLEDEMGEAGAAGFEGAAGVSAFAAASEGLGDSMDDIDIEDAIGELEDVADNVDDAVDAFDELDDAALDDSTDPFNLLGAGESATQAADDVTGAVDDIENRIDGMDLEDDWEPSGREYFPGLELPLQMSPVGGGPDQQAPFDEVGDIANLNPRFLTSGKVSDITPAQLSDFTANEDDSRREKRFARMASDLSKISRSGDLLDLFDETEKGNLRMAEFVDRATASKGVDMNEFLKERKGKLFPEGKAKIIFRDLLEREGTITPKTFRQEIRDRYDEELETARQRQRQLDRVSDLLDDSGRAIRDAFGSLDDIDPDRIKQNREQFQGLVEFTDDFTYEEGVLEEVLLMGEEDTPLMRAAQRVRSDQAGIFNNVFGELDGDLFDDEQARRAFGELLRNDVADLNQTHSSKKRKFDGFGEVQQLIGSFDRKVLSKIRESDVFQSNRMGFEMLETIIDGDESFEHLSEFAERDIRDRIDALRAAEGAPDRQSRGFREEHFREMTSILNRFARDSRDALEGEFGSDFRGMLRNTVREDGLDDGTLPMVDQLNDRFAETVGPEQDIRDKKSVAETVQAITSDPLLLDTVANALDEDGSLNRRKLNKALDQQNFSSDRIEELLTFAEVFGEDIFGQDTAEYRDRDPNLANVFPDDDMVEIDAITRETFDTNTPAQREPLNRAVRDLQQQNIPLTEETVRANLFQQASDTQSEEFRRLIGDVDRMIKDNQIEIDSLLNNTNAQPVFEEEINHRLRKAGVDSDAAKELTDEIFDDISSAVRKRDDIGSIDELFFDEDAANLRDVLQFARSDVEQYNASLEQVIDSAEDGTKNVRRFFEELAGEDVDVLGDDESLLQSWKRFTRDAEDLKVKELFGDNQIVPVDVRLRRFVQRSAAGRGPQGDGLAGTVAGGIRGFTNALPDRLVKTDAEALQASGGIKRFQRALRNLTPELGITSANLGPLNVSLRNMGSVIVGLVATLGPLLTLVGGLITGFVTLAGAIGSVTAVGALGFFEQLESQFGGINSRMEAVEATFNAVRKMGREAIAPLENATLAGMSGSEFFQRSIQRSMQLLNHFARIFADIAEMDEVTASINRISEALFTQNGDTGPSMMEAMRVATERLVPIITDLVVYMINNLPEFIIFISRISDMVDGPLAFALTEWIDLFGSLITIGAGFISVYANVAGLIAFIVNQLEALNNALDALPDWLYSSDDGDGMGALFRLGQGLGLLFAAGAAFTAFKKLSGAITLAANALGRLLTLAGRGGRLTRLGKFLSGVGGNGAGATARAASASRSTGRAASGAARSARYGGRASGAARAASGGKDIGLLRRMLGAPVEGLRYGIGRLRNIGIGSRVKGMFRGLGRGLSKVNQQLLRFGRFTREVGQVWNRVFLGDLLKIPDLGLLGRLRNIGIPSGIKNLFGGGGDRGMMHMIDLFSKLGSMGSKLSKLLGPIAKIGRFLFRIVNPLGWVLDIITAIYKIYQDVQFLLGNRRATDREVFGSTDPSSFSQQERREMRERGNDRSTVRTGPGRGVTVNINNPDDVNDVVNGVKRAIRQNAETESRHNGESPNNSSV